MRITDFCDRNSLNVDSLHDEFDRLDALVPDDDEDMDNTAKAAALNLIEPQAGDNWLTLQEWLDELDGISDLYTERGFENELDDVFDSETSNLPWWVAVDKKETIDNLRQDYTEIDIDNENFYYR